MGFRSTWPETRPSKHYHYYLWILSAATKVYSGQKGATGAILVLKQKQDDMESLRTCDRARSSNKLMKSKRQ